MDKLGDDGRELLELVRKDGRIDVLTRKLSLLYEEYDFVKGKAFDLITMLLEIVKMPYTTSPKLSGKAAFDQLVEWLRVLVRDQDRVYVSIQQVEEQIQKVINDNTPKERTFNKGEFRYRPVTEGVISDIWNKLKSYVMNAFKSMKSYENRIDKIKSLLSK